jgi:hypothetical protein
VSKPEFNSAPASALLRAAAPAPPSETRPLSHGCFAGTAAFLSVLSILILVILSSLLTILSRILSSLLTILSKIF